jgi:hypothetical protein
VSRRVIVHFVLVSVGERDTASTDSEKAPPGLGETQKKSERLGEREKLKRLRDSG